MLTFHPAPQRAELPTQTECTLVQACLVSLHNVTDAALRHKVDHFLQLFLLRIRAGAHRTLKTLRLSITSPFQSVTLSTLPDSVAIPYRYNVTASVGTKPISVT
jgi:hypothetical protein